MEPPEPGAINAQGDDATPQSSGGTDSQAPPDISISEAAELCRERFRTCLSISSAANHTTHAGVQDQFARFSMWADNIRASAPGRASLDYRLRDALELRNLISDLLGGLSATVDECE